MGDTVKKPETVEDFITGMVRGFFENLDELVYLTPDQRADIEMVIRHQIMNALMRNLREVPRIGHGLDAATGRDAEWEGIPGQQIRSVQTLQRHCKAGRCNGCCGCSEECTDNPCGNRLFAG